MSAPGKRKAPPAPAPAPERPKRSKHQRQIVDIGKVRRSLVQLVDWTDPYCDHSGDGKLAWDVHREVIEALDLLNDVYEVAQDMGIADTLRKDMARMCPPVRKARDAWRREFAKARTASRGRK